MVGNRIRSRGRLPHWESEHGIYFVTFRLADSLPRTVVRELRESEKAKPERERQPSKAIEEYLDQGAGDCCLRVRPIADLVVSALQRFDGIRYKLFAWCIMPNHVHLIFQPLGGYALDQILHSWKSFTASEINRRLGRKGALWQREYYDHLLRDGQQLGRAISYTAENPRKAGLADWDYVYVAAEAFGGATFENVSLVRKTRGRGQ